MLSKLVEFLRRYRVTHAAIGALIIYPILLCVFIWSQPPFSAAIAVFAMYYMREIRQAQEKKKSWQDTYYIWRYEEWDRNQTYRLVLSLLIVTMITNEIIGRLTS